MLNFVGCGSAFNTKLGNNSAFFVENETLNLIDCGADVFSNLISKNILNSKIKEINIIVTHVHTDHVGSLADLCFYAYIKMKTKTTVYAPKQVKEYLTLVGVLAHQIDFYLISDKDNFMVKDSSISLTVFKTTHYTDMESYGFELKNKVTELKYLYTGDCSEIPEKILAKINKNEYEIVYVDTSSNDFEGNPHLSLSKLDSVIEKDVKLRKSIYCMHLDGGLLPKDFNNTGFYSAEHLLYIK